MGTITMPGITIKFNDLDETDFSSAPMHGQDTKAYLETIGYSAEEISVLIEEKVAEVL